MTNKQLSAFLEAIKIITETNPTKAAALIGRVQSLLHSSPPEKGQKEKPTGETVEK